MKRDIAIRCLLTGVLFLCGCNAAAPRVDPERRLPFIVKVRGVKVAAEARAGEETAVDGGIATPARFGDEEMLARDLVRRLDEAEVFSLVVAADDRTVRPDLELEVEVSGRDFGPGQPAVGGAILSTIAWLFTGHLSWFIDNRTYPESKVLMSVRIRRPDDGPRAGEAEAAATAESKRPLFQDPLPLKGLALPFVERAEPANWFLNIVVPPWWGDASPEAAGGSLAEKSMDFFAEQAPTRIAERLPAAYFGEAQTYLIFDRAGNRLLIASQQALRRLTISSTSGRGSRRTLTQEKLETYWAQGEEARAMRNSILATGILAPDEDDRYYSVPLLKREREFVRVEGELANQASTGPYTVFVEP